MNKTELLQRLEEEARQVLYKPGTNLVFGEGNPDALIMLIGEAPGFHEDQQGRPFVGAAGKLLDRLLALANISRQEVYITNVLKNRPPNNRDPLPQEINEAARFLDSQLAIVNPEVVITLGRFSMNKFLPGVKISQVHGNPKQVGKIFVVPMYHPAAALRARSVMVQEEDDFRRLPDILKNMKKRTINEGDAPQLGLF